MEPTMKQKIKDTLLKVEAVLAPYHNVLTATLIVLLALDILI